MNRTLLLASAALTCLPLARTLAQSSDSAQLQRLAEDRRRGTPPVVADAPDFYPDESEEIGPQSILATKPRHRWINLDLGSELYYDSNIYYTEKDPVGRSVSVDHANFFITPPSLEPSWGVLSPRIGYQYQWYLYGVFDSDPTARELDFDNGDFYAQMSYNKGDWQAQLSFDWSQLYSHATGDYWNIDKFYEEWVPGWLVQRSIRLGERDSLALAYLGSYHFTWTEETAIAGVLFQSTRNNRWENMLVASWSHNFTDSLSFTPYYRLLLSSYTEIERFDQLNTFGASLVWRFAPFGYVRGFVNYDLQNSSDTSVFDYHKLTTGGGVNVTFSF